MIALLRDIVAKHSCAKAEHEGKERQSPDNNGDITLWYTPTASLESASEVGLAHSTLAENKVKAKKDRTVFIVNVMFIGCALHYGSLGEAVGWS
jgi:hypothetical protein